MKGRMNQRPKAGESEEDLLRLQAEFLKEVTKPSVTVKKADKRKASASHPAGNVAASQVQQAQGERVKRDVVTLPGLPPTLPAEHPPKRSKFKARQDVPGAARPSPFSGQKVTFDLNDDEEDDPDAAMDKHDTHITAVLSKIREQDTRSQAVFLPRPTGVGFPTALHRSQKTAQTKNASPGKKRSLFAQQFESTPPVDFGVTLGPPVRAAPLGEVQERDVADMETEVSRNTVEQAVPFPAVSLSSSILDGSGLGGDVIPSAVARQQAQEIHAENVSKMASMSEEEILKEQAQLRAMLDPSLVTFLQRNKPSKEQKRGGKEDVADQSSSSRDAPLFKPSATDGMGDGEEMDTSTDHPAGLRLEGTAQESSSEMEQRPGDASSVSEPSMEARIEVKDDWLNMKKVEEDKLAWMSDLPKPSAKSTAGAQARFDFNGRLVDRGAAVPVREGLYHHGDEQEIPGYSLEELFSLCRSAVTQQRALALQTLAKVIYNYRAGSLGGQLKTPLITRLLKAGVLFLLRWSIDDSNEGVLSAGIEALAALLIQAGDEESLDKVFTWQQGCCAPPMLPPKISPGEEGEEDEEDDDDDDDEEEGDEQKQSKPDEHIASQDVIKGLIKMSLLPRLRYILEVVRPAPPIIMHTISILIRIARHSPESAMEVFKCPRQMDTIFKEFLPTTSWCKQDDPVSNLYGHPTVLAMKLVRVLCLSGRHLAATILSRYPLMAAILRYTSMEPTNMNLNVGEAFHLSTESLRAWSVCVRYGFACDAYREIYPLLMQQLQLFQRLSVLPLPSSEEEVTCMVHRLQLIRASTLISLLEGVVQVAGTAAELQEKLMSRNDGTKQDTPTTTATPPPPIDWSHVTGLATPMEMCVRRWLAEMTGCTEVLEPEASALAGSALGFMATFFTQGALQASYSPVDSLQHIEDFVDTILLPYMKSSSFFSAVHNLQMHSSSTYTPSDHVRPSTRALPSFCCCLGDDRGEAMPPCVRRTSTMGYGTSLFRLTHRLNTLHKGVARRFEPIVLSCYVLPYLENFCREHRQAAGQGLAEHFAVHEHVAVFYLIKIFQSVVQQVESCKHHSQLYHSAAMKLLAHLQPGCEHYAHDLLSTALFSPEFLAEGSTGDPMAADLAEFLTVSDTDNHQDPQKEGTSRSGRGEPSRGELLQEAYGRLSGIRSLYMVYFGKEQRELLRSRAKCLGRPHEVSSLTMPPLVGPLLPLDWPFLPLVQLFSEAQKAEMKGKSVKSLPPHIMAAVTDTLRWVFMLETWRPSTLASIPLAAKIARLYCVFLTASELFMETSVHHYLQALLKIYTTQDYLKNLNFDQKIPGLASFHDLYDALLTQFEAASFGDPLFASYVLLPLQQEFSFHFRKALWLDHVEVMRILRIPLAECPIPVANFLHPLEEDPALITIYYQSLAQGRVRASWSPIMHLVTVHHVVGCVFGPPGGRGDGGEGKGEKENPHMARTRLKILKGLMALQNEELKQMLLLYRGPDPSAPRGYTLYEALPPERAHVLQAAQRAVQQSQGRS